MSPWIPVIVTIVLGLAGLGIQGLVFAYFLGRMKEHQQGQAQLVQTFQRFTESALEALTTRMSAMDKFASDSTAHRSELAARLGAIEASAEGMPRFREEFAEHRAEARAHMRRMESDVARVNMALEGLQRQVGSLATHGPGKLIELPAERGKS